jgi:hypothetical protein
MNEFIEESLIEVSGKDILIKQQKIIDRNAGINFLIITDSLLLPLLYSIGLYYMDVVQKPAPRNLSVYLRNH